MSRSSIHAFVLAALLFAAGAAVFAAKIVNFDFPVLPGRTETLWTVEIYLEFTATGKPARIASFVPARVEGRLIQREQVFSGPFGLNFETDARGNRRAIWSYRFPDNRRALRYSASISAERQGDPFLTDLSPENAAALEVAQGMIQRQALINWIDELRRRSADDATFVELTLSTIFNPEPREEVEALLPNLRPPLDRLALSRLVLGTEGVPARIANGVALQGAQRRAELLHWLEYTVDGRQQRYFPGNAPARFLTIWHGAENLTESSGIQGLDAQVSLRAAPIAAQEMALAASQLSGSLLSAFGFHNLPVTVQILYQVLITIPVGIVILVFFRQFVGIETVGTFMPVLIGIAFRETSLLNGIVMFSLLVALGLALRFYLERLQLLLVPRLAVVLIFIIGAMAVISGVTSTLGLTTGLSIALFPMVIVTMTVERMSIMWEELSPGDAMQAGLGSLLIAAIAYLAMSNRYVEHIMFTFPETILILMALCILMGRYTGLRLAELWRFRSLMKS